VASTALVCACVRKAATNARTSSSTAAPLAAAAVLGVEGFGVVQARKGARARGNKRLVMRHLA